MYSVFSTNGGIWVYEDTEFRLWEYSDNTFIELQEGVSPKILHMLLKKYPIVRYAVRNIHEVLALFESEYPEEII